MTTDRSTAYALDPAAWLRSHGVPPDPWQADVLRSSAPQTLLNCSRQSGKTLTAAALGLHEAMYTPESLVLILSPSLRQSGELYRNASTLYDGSVPSEAETKTHMELANGSRIICLPGTEKTIRSFSNVALLIIDEAARTEDALYYAIRPMLAVSGGRIIALSTPFGKRGWYWQEWAYGGEAWKRVMINAYDCPRISLAFLEQERTLIGDWWFRQEYECVFNDAIDSYFREEDIVAAFSDAVQPLYQAA